MRQILGFPLFRRYLASQTLAMLGSSSLWLAMSIWVRELTGSNSAAGLVAFVYILGTLCAPLSGVVVDRVRRRRLLIAADGTLAGFVLLLLLVDGRGGLWLVYTVMFGYGLVGSLINSAQSALISEMVPQRLRPDANGALSTVREGLRLLSPMVGAGAYAAVGATSVIWLVSCLFALAALVQCTVRFRERIAQHRRGGEGVCREMLGGVRHLVGVRPLRHVVVACCCALMVFGFTESVIFAVADEGLGRPASFVGVLIVAQGAGAIVAGVTAATVVRRYGEAAAVAAGLAISCAGIWLTAGPALWVVLPGTALFGFGLPWISVGAVTLLQRLTPPQLQGRAYAALNVVFNAPQAASIALGAGLVAVVPYRLLLTVIGAVMGLAALGLVLAGRATAPLGRVETAVSTLRTK